MKTRPVYSAIFAIFLFLNSSGCKSIQNTYQLPTLSEKGHIHAVIEIPAGTNHKIEINPQSGKFENDIKDGKIRVVKFLPYPGNYGFIPSTFMDTEKGGDGDALDILVIAESVPTGTIMEVELVGGLAIIDHEEIDTKLIGIPVDPKRVLIRKEALSFEKGTESAALTLIRDWFINYKNDKNVRFQGWLSQEEAMTEINKWKK